MIVFRIQTTGSVATVEPRLARVLITDDEREMEIIINLALSERCLCEYASSLERARQRLADDAFDLRPLRAAIVFAISLPTAKLPVSFRP